MSSFLEIDKCFQFSISNANQYKLRQEFEEDKQSNFWKTLDRFTFTSSAPFYIPSTPFPMISINDFIAIASVEELIIKARKRDKWYTLHTIPIDIDPYPQFAQIFIKNQQVFYTNSLGFLRCYSLLQGTLLYHINLCQTIKQRCLIRTFSKFSRLISQFHILINDDQLLCISYTGHIIWFSIKCDIILLLQGIYDLHQYVLNVKFIQNSINLLVVSNIHKLQDVKLKSIEMSSINELGFVVDDFSNFPIPTISISSFIHSDFFMINNIIHKSNKTTTLKAKALANIQNNLFVYDQDKPLTLLNSDDFSPSEFISNCTLDDNKVIKNNYAYQWHTQQHKSATLKVSTSLYATIFAIFDYFISLILWQFNPSISTDTIQYECTIYVLSMSTLLQMYQSMLKSLNYGQALIMAKQLNISSSDVYKVQWQHTPVTPASLSILTHIDDVEWLLETCCQRVPNHLESCILLNEYGLSISQGADDNDYNHFSLILRDTQRRLQFLSKCKPQIPMHHIYDPFEYLDENTEFSLYFSVFRSFDLVDLMQYFLLTNQINQFNIAVQHFNISPTIEDCNILLPYPTLLTISQNTQILDLKTQQVKMQNLLLDFLISTTATMHLKYAMYTEVQLIATALSFVSKLPMLGDILKEIRKIDLTQIIEFAPFNPSFLTICSNFYDPKALATTIYQHQIMKIGIKTLINEEMALIPLFQKYHFDDRFIITQIIIMIVKYTHFNAKLTNNPINNVNHLQGLFQNWFHSGLSNDDYAFLLRLYHILDTVQVHHEPLQNILHYFKLFLMQFSIPCFCKTFDAEYFQYLKVHYFTLDHNTLMSYTMAHVLELDIKLIPNLLRLVQLANIPILTTTIAFIQTSQSIGLGLKEMNQLLQTTEPDLINILKAGQYPMELVQLICILHGIDVPFISAKRTTKMDRIQDITSNVYFDSIFDISNECRTYLQMGDDGQNSNNKIMMAVYKEFRNVDPLQHYLQQCFSTDNLENIRYFKEILRKYSANDVMAYVNKHLTERKPEILDLFTLILLRNIGWEFHSKADLHPKTIEGYLQGIQVLIRNGFPSLKQEIIVGLVNTDFGIYAKEYLITTLFIHNLEAPIQANTFYDALLNDSGENLDSWQGKMIDLNRKFNKEKCDELFEILYSEDVEIPLGIASRYIHTFKEDCYYFGCHTRYNLLVKKYEFPTIETGVLVELQQMLLHLISK